MKKPHCRGVQNLHLPSNSPHRYRAWHICGGRQTKLRQRGDRHQNRWFVRVRHGRNLFHRRSVHSRLRPNKRHRRCPAERMNGDCQQILKSALCWLGKRSLERVYFVPHLCHHPVSHRHCSPNTSPMHRQGGHKRDRNTSQQTWLFFQNRRAM